MTLTYQSIDSANDEWLDSGSISNDTGSALYFSKNHPLPPPPPPPPTVDESIIRAVKVGDTLESRTGDDKLYGSKGTDTAVFHGAFEDYDLTFTLDEGFRLTDSVGGRDGSDLLSSIERLQFDGLVVLLDAIGNAWLEDGTVLLTPPEITVPEPPGPATGEVDWYGTAPDVTWEGTIGLVGVCIHWGDA